MSSESESRILEPPESAEGVLETAETGRVAIRVSDVSKKYAIFQHPEDRLKQMLIPRLSRLLGRASKPYYREFTALRNVSLDILQGETVGIVGRNGSGKSTLLQIICGTLEPTTGTVATSGRIAALLELGSGFNPEFTGKENIFMNAAVLGMTRPETEERYSEIVAFSELEDFIEQPVKTYSSGMVMRLAFSVAIGAQPRILVVDEALSVGDERFQRKCFSRIESLRSNKCTILFVSHAGNTVVDLCDRAVLMDSGEVLLSGAPNRVVAQYRKLLYAQGEQLRNLKEEIRQSKDVHSVPQAIDDSAEIPVQAPEEIHTNSAGPSFDPGFVSTSNVSYPDNGANIVDIGLFTLDGERVNIIVSGEIYRYRYRVVFSRDAVNIRFGMLIKTISGVEIGGAVTAQNPNAGLPVAVSGSEYSVDFTFRCLLNEGTYFLNAGVLGVVDGEDTFLHRVVDALAFRVLLGARRNITGVVDFGCSWTHSRLRPAAEHQGLDSVVSV